MLVSEKSPILMKIKNGTEEQDSKIPRMLKAKAFVGILDIQNVLHLSLSN